MRTAIAAGLLFCSGNIATPLPPDCKGPADLVAAIAQEPSAEAYNALGYSFIEQQQHKCAVAAFTSAVKLDPKSFESQYNLGIALYEADDFSAAVEHLRVATGIRPGDQNAQSALAASLHYFGLNLAAQNRFTEASLALKKSLELAPRNPEVISALGKVFVRQRQFEQAVSLFRDVVALQPASSEAHLNLGIALADFGRPAEALSSFEKAVRLSPNSAAARYNKGRALHDMQRYQEARPVLESALRLDPKSTATLLLLGITEARLGDNTAAAVSLKRVLVAEPANATAHLELGQVSIVLDKGNDAVLHLKRAVELDPADSKATYALLRVLSARQSPEAAEYGRRVRELKKDELTVSRARVLSNFGLDAAKAKDWQKAISQLREAIQICGDCHVIPVLRRNLGLILAQSGDLAGAAIELKLARELDPEDRDVQYALELLPRLALKR